MFIRPSLLLQKDKYNFFYVILNFFKVILLHVNKKSNNLKFFRRTNLLQFFMVFVTMQYAFRLINQYLNNLDFWLFKSLWIPKFQIFRD
jgi:hypothetical protein